MTEREWWAKNRNRNTGNWWQNNATQRARLITTGKTTRPRSQREAAPVTDTEKAKLLKLAHEVEDGWARDYQ